MKGLSEERSARRYRCQWCGEPYHPNKSGKRLYCGNTCLGAANRNRAQRLRELREAAYFKTMTPKRIVAGLAALHVEPQLWDETRDEVTS